MSLDRKQSFRRGVAALLVLCFALPNALAAETHVVGQAELQQRLLAGSQARQRNLRTVEEFLSTPQAQKALQSMGENPQQVKTAVSALNDAELANLAARAQNAQAQFAAGNLTDRDLLVLTLLLLALILIIVAVR